MEGVTQLGYDELLKLEKSIASRKQQLEGAFKKKQIVYFRPAVQSGKVINVIATIQKVPGTWDEDRRIHIYCHGNSDFPASQCVTSASKLRPYEGNDVKPMYGDPKTIPGGIPQFEECKTCILDTRAGSCRCMQMHGAYKY